mmetsp:Transcript_71811/g.162968  ORF Transcript_71811/g.162968 Transcript_71811/m.162968 type:complete len:278 (+) Transcript_71811:65-898(+)
MSDLRQRKGDKSQEAGAEFMTAQTTGSSMTAEGTAREIEQMVKKLQEGPKPGLSNNAKKWKDELREDPYNLKYIMELGFAYAADKQWDRCCNVMIRGWKRMSEIPDRGDRARFLLALCTASVNLEKYQQASAVLADIEVDPGESADVIMKHKALTCEVLCHNNDAAGGLRAFHKAIEGLDFESACAIWGSCYNGLGKIGAVDITKSKLEAMAEDESAKARLSLVEQLTVLRSECTKVSKQKTWSRAWLFIPWVIMTITLGTVGWRAVQQLGISLDRI